MITPEPAEESRQARVDAALADYLRRIDRGEPVNRTHFLAEHPELAEDLRGFFEASDEFELLAGAPSGVGRLAVNASTPMPRSETLAELTLSPGRVFGDYEVQEEIGRGGMGVVFKARQVSLNRTVALKMIVADRLASPADVQRFRREAETAGQLDHPNIVPIYDIGERPGDGVLPSLHYFSMKLLAGGTLAGHVARLTGDPRTTAQLLAIVARAVHHAHQRGLLHRDLKPANILLDTEGRPHVADFGLAKRVELESDLTQSGLLIGTPSYMAPEQSFGKKEAITTATDVYGLGTVLYEMLTGRPPFREASALETLLQVRERDPDRPRLHNPRVVAELETICLKCLEKEPALRYGSALALAEDLERWLRGEPILARPAGTWEKIVKWTRRQPMLAALILLSCVLVVGGMAGVLSQWLRAETALGDTALALDAEKQERKEKERALDAERELNALLQVHLHSYRISAAEREFQANHVEEATRILRECEPARRSWDWHYLNRLAHSEQLVCRGHRGNVYGVAFSPDGKRLISTGEDNTLRVWDATTGREVLSATAPPQKPGEPKPEPIAGVCCSPDGKLLATAGGSGVVLWSASTGQEIRTLERSYGSGFRSVAFSADGQRIVAGHAGNSVGIWDTASGKKVLALQTIHLARPIVAFSPDGNFLAVGSLKGTLQLWDMAAGRWLPPLEAHRDPVRSVTYSPDGKLLASGGADALVHLWDSNTLSEGHAARDRPKATLRGHAAPVLAVAFSPDGKRLATADSNRVLKVWELSSGHEVMTLRGNRAIGMNVAFSPDGLRVAAGGTDGAVRVWDAVSPPEYRSLGGPEFHVASVAFAPDGPLYLAAARQVKRWDLKAGREATALEIPALADASAVTCLALSPDGKLLAVGTSSLKKPIKGRVWALKVCDARTGKELYDLEGHGNLVGTVAFSPDGTLLASGSLDRTIKLWDLKTGKETATLRGHTDAVREVVFTPEGGQVLSAGRDDKVLLWDVAAGKEVRTFEWPANKARFVEKRPGYPIRPSELSRVAVAPNGQWLAATSKQYTVTVWELQTGQERFTLRGHADEVSSIAVSPDNQRLVTGSRDGSIKLWDAATGQELFTLGGHSQSVTSVRFSPDGHFLVSVDHQGLVRIRDGSPRKLD